MDLDAVMQEIATRLDTIAGLRVYGYPTDTVQPPAAVVGYPESIDFDQTYGRGVDTIALPVVVVVGKVYDRATRDALSKYCDGAGAASLKAVLEPDPHTAFNTVRVARVEFDVVTYNGIDYAAAIFDLAISGKGTS